jgi:hypothetical protein
MSGTFLHRGPIAHRCEMPPAGHMGDVWRCDCGRRWYCWSARTERVGGGYLVGPHWRRSYWPWPRTARTKWVNLPESGNHFEPVVEPITPPRGSGAGSQGNRSNCE